LRPIVCDPIDFIAPTLTQQTLALLNASHALIVICSPASAQSNFVSEQVRIFSRIAGTNARVAKSRRAIRSNGNKGAADAIDRRAFLDCLSFLNVLPSLAKTCRH
jgi:hypothetical protein